MAESRVRAGDIPRETAMKLMTTITVSAAVMAAGCMQSQYARLRQTARSVPTMQEWNEQQRRRQVVYAPVPSGGPPATIVFNEASPPVRQAPQPVIVLGPGSPAATTISQVGNSTFIGSFGFSDYRPPIVPYYGY